MRTFITAEIGINHNGSMDIARELIDVAARAGCDAVKFQVGDPDRYVAPHQRDLVRDTPMGTMRYVEYRRFLEFDDDQLAELGRYALAKGVEWYASPLDASAVPRLVALGVRTLKIASPMATDGELLDAVRMAPVKDIILSTGGCTLEQVDEAVERLRPSVIMHCVSAYPTPPELINLRMIESLRSRYRLPVGYSGHEIGLQTTVAAVALGATYVERHITLSRAMWGSDQPLSVEPQGLVRLVRDIRTLEVAMGDGVKRVHELEQDAVGKFRRVVEAA